MKKAFDGLISKLDSAVERTSQPEETSMNTFKTKMQRKKPVASLNAVNLELALTLIHERECTKSHLSQLEGIHLHLLTHGLQQIFCNIKNKL